MSFISCHRVPLQTDLRSWSLMAGAFTCWAIWLVQSLYYFCLFNFKHLVNVKLMEEWCIQLFCFHLFTYFLRMHTYKHAILFFFRIQGFKYNFRIVRLKIILNLEEISYSKYYLLKQVGLHLETRGTIQKDGTSHSVQLIIHKFCLDVILKPRFSGMLVL